MKKNYIKWITSMMESWKKLEGAKTAELFSYDVKYYETLDAPPCNSFDEVIRLWEIVPENQRNIEYDFDLIAVSDDCAIVNWTMHRRMKIESAWIKQYIDGIFQIKLDDAGKCCYFKQWRFTKVEQ